MDYLEKSPVWLHAPRAILRNLLLTSLCISVFSCELRMTLPFLFLVGYDNDKTTTCKHLINVSLDKYDLALESHFYYIALIFLLVTLKDLPRWCTRPVLSFIILQLLISHKLIFHVYCPSRRKAFKVNTSSHSLFSAFSMHIFNFRLVMWEIWSTHTCEPVSKSRTDIANQSQHTFHAEITWHLFLCPRALSSFYTNSGNMDLIEADLEHRFEPENWSVRESLQKTIEVASLENYSLTDFWAYVVISRQTREVSPSNWACRAQV
jgi:hypothetical protein